MKNKILIFVLLITMIFSFTSCNSQKKAYKELNKCTEANYSQITINITTVSNNATLNAEYVVDQNFVTYSVDQLNMLSTDANIGDLPTSYISTFIGIAEVKNGQVTTIEGEPVSLPSYDALTGSFNFDENNFDNVEISDAKFVGNPIIPSDFFGTSVNARNMHVEVFYSNNCFNEIYIQYETDTGSVNMSYYFR